VSLCNASTLNVPSAEDISNCVCSHLNPTLVIGKDVIRISTGAYLAVSYGGRDESVYSTSVNKRQGGQKAGNGSRYGYCPSYKHYFPVAVLCSSLSQLLCR
jgi:hypothetical protein